MQFDTFFIHKNEIGLTRLISVNTCILLSHYLAVLFILVDTRTRISSQLIGLLNIKALNGSSLVILWDLDIVIVQSKWERVFILLAELITIATSEYLEFLFHWQGIHNGLFRNMEIWENINYTNLNYTSKLIDYPDYQGSLGDGELIRINGDQCTWCKKSDLIFLMHCVKKYHFSCRSINFCKLLFTVKYD